MLYAYAKAFSMSWYHCNVVRAEPIPRDCASFDAGKMRAEQQILAISGKGKQSRMTDSSKKHQVFMQSMWRTVIQCQGKDGQAHCVADPPASPSASGPLPPTVPTADSFYDTTSWEMVDLLRFKPSHASLFCKREGVSFCRWEPDLIVNEPEIISISDRNTKSTTIAWNNRDHLIFFSPNCPML